MANAFYQRLKLRIDTSAKWAAANPVLLPGELAVVLIDGSYSNVRFKLGQLGMDEDPITHELGTKYNALPFTDEVSLSNINGKKNLQEAISSEGSATKTVVGFTQDEQGVVNLTFADIAFPTSDGPDIYVQSDAPTDPAEGAIWIDTSEGENSSLTPAEEVEF